MVTAIPPIAGIFMTLLIAYLVKMLARVTGTPWEHAPPPPAYGSIGGYGSPIQGAVWRPEGAPYGAPAPWGPYGQMPSPPTSTNGHPGIGAGALEDGNNPGGTKRALIDMYLSGLTPEQLQVATRESIVGALERAGATVNPREAGRVLEEHQSALRKAARDGRKR